MLVTYKMSSKFALLFLLLFVVKFAVCRWTLDIQLYSYINPTSRTRFGSCCDSDGNLYDNACTDPCDNVFTFCLRPTPSSRGCQYGVYHTGLVPGGDSLTFTANSVIGENSVPNPMTFNGIQWPNNDMFFLLVAIDDNDEFSGDDFIESFGRNIEVPHITNGTINVTINTYVELQIGFRMRCQQYYYGYRCNVYCQPSNDTENGYYTCDSYGNKVCREGYKYNETNCITPIEFITSTSIMNGISLSSIMITSSFINPASSGLLSMTTISTTLLPSIAISNDVSISIAPNTSNSNSTTGIVIGLVVGLLVMLTITALVIITLFVLHKRRHNERRKLQVQGHTTIDNPNYHSSNARTLIDGEIYSSNYYLISHNHGFERTLQNPLYDNPSKTTDSNTDDPLYYLADEINSSIPSSSDDVHYSGLYNASDIEPSYHVIRNDIYITEQQTANGNYPQNIEGHYEFDSV